MSNPLMTATELWTVREVAAFLKVSTSWVYKQAEAGLLPVRRIGANLRFYPTDIDAYARGTWSPTSSHTQAGR